MAHFCVNLLCYLQQMCTSNTQLLWSLGISSIVFMVESVTYRVFCLEIEEQISSQTKQSLNIR